MAAIYVSSRRFSAMVVTNKIKYDTPRVRMAGSTIEMVDEIKILGLILDKKLTFNSHVKHVCTKVLNIYKPLARSAKINWGLRPEIIKTIYVSVIEPIVLYGASIWAPAAQKLTIQKHLNAIQRGFALKILKAYRTVSLTAALALAGLVPLDLRVQEAASLFIAKRGKPQGEIAELAVEKKKRFFDLPHPACEIEINFDKVNDMDDLVARRNTTGEIEMYTDGSKIGGKVGAALTYWKNDKEIGKKKFLLATQCTVYQAELYALYQATEIAAKLKDTVINIYSDSRSSLETISNIHTYHPLAFEIRKTLTKLKLNNKIVKLFWIKAHVGVEGNERADQLAKEAALTKKTAPDYDACPTGTSATWRESWIACKQQKKGDGSLSRQTSMPTRRYGIAHDGI
ncbi:uncharacterized protein LOC128198962 [Bicyclus anynana]|uniref:ribonuclease H n=1 Tax=Bicyclus anynana TaxID=110368 RepID=A0ABM3LV44_BICAN|nr:uncharacterized protein LOC128198962 [Bicyclus anynana]